MDEDIQNAAPMMVCVVGMLVFAADRNDQRLVDAIGFHFDRLPKPTVDVILLDRELCHAVLSRVTGPERDFWATAANLAAAHPEYRPGFHELARLRIIDR